VGSDGPVRALVVDDSSFMRTLISDILEAGGIDVVGEAANGVDAVDQVEDLHPDVVTMDVEMPEMDGVEAVRALMSTSPTPVLMLSAHTEADADVTFAALEEGAVDFFPKPGGEISIEMNRFRDQLVEKVLVVANSTVTPGTPDGAALGGQELRGTDPGPLPGDGVLVIGASTGGPKIVESILGALPAEPGLTVLVVQHMPAAFTSRFADRLHRASTYTIAEASEGDPLEPGRGYVAPGDRHLLITRNRSGAPAVALSEAPRVNGARPSIDRTMSSVAEQVTEPTVAVILTGMGRDGAAGVEAVASVDGWVIAQDEPTSAVNGMPQRAIETGDVDSVLPANEIARGILEGLSSLAADSRGDSSHV